ncbi:hypothetical protein D6817_04090, partial [Candidatus Pacearchaeota archaeon]
KSQPTLGAALAGFGGFMGTSAVIQYLQQSQLLGSGFGSFLGTIGPLAAIGVGVAIFLSTAKKRKVEIVRFECLPWQAPIGGENCEKCNEDPSLPCSEYRCRSLGQACQLLNPGTDKPLCAWVNKDDTTSPRIEVWQEALKPRGLRYVPDNRIRPPNRGFKIMRKGAPAGCLNAFTDLQFGIKTDEPAQCKIDYELKDTFDDMGFYFGETTLYDVEHVQRLKVPQPFKDDGTPAEGGPVLHNDGTFTLWVRCRDANGNENVDAVAFSFCVAKGPDTIPPTIEASSIRSGQPVAAGADSVPIEIFTNEPAECRWSRQDKAYDAMENEMTCNNQLFEVNARLNYVCSGELTGIVDREQNNFYFRCKDLHGNVMDKSLALTLRGTEELVLDEVGPNGTIEGATSVVTVTLTAKTSHGADDGKAVCMYSTNPDDETSFIPMENTNNFLHSQDLDLTAGTYRYYFLCVDAGGNAARGDTVFTVKVDKKDPLIARVYRDGNELKLITNEPAECVYSTTTCNFNFEEGLPFVYDTAGNGVDKTQHLTEFSTENTYYIKCQDLKGNRPRPEQCQMIVRGADL